MKRIILGVLVALLFMFAGCIDDEGYSLNNVWLGFGVIQKSDAASPSESPNIIMDNKDVLVSIASNYFPEWHANLEHGARVLVNYTILEEDINSSTPRYFVKVNSIDNILMKGVLDITPEKEDSIGNDPIVINNYWMTDSLLNFKLEYWGNNTIHFLNLVKQPDAIIDELQPLELELRHNANNDDKSIPFTAYVSFSLNDLRIEGSDSIQIVINSTDYDGIEYTEECVFYYSDFDN